MALCDDLRLEKVYALRACARPSFADQETLFMTFGLLAGRLRQAQRSLCRDVYLHVTSAAGRELDGDGDDDSASL